MQTLFNCIPCDEKQTQIVDSISNRSHSQQLKLQLYKSLKMKLTSLEMLYKSICKKYVNVSIIVDKYLRDTNDIAISEIKDKHVSFEDENPNYKAIVKHFKSINDRLKKSIKAFDYDHYSYNEQYKKFEKNTELSIEQVKECIEEECKKIDNPNDKTIETIRNFIILSSEYLLITSFIRQCLETVHEHIADHNELRWKEEDYRELKRFKDIFDNSTFHRRINNRLNMPTSASYIIDKIDLDRIRSIFQILSSRREQSAIYINDITESIENEMDYIITESKNAGFANFINKVMNRNAIEQGRHDKLKKQIVLEMDNIKEAISQLGNL